MCGMILRLDSRRPLVWRSPRTLQIGVDPRLAVLDNVTDADARLIDALTAGITRAGLATLAAQAGVPPRRVDEVLRAVDPALERPDERGRDAQRPPVAIVGRGEAAARVAGVLGEAGHPVAVGASITRVGGRRPAAAVLVSSHVADPLEHQRWLRRDIAHLPVVFGEVAVTVGPLVVPGVTACLTCIERQRAADDDAWPAVAAQLWGRTAPTETVARATESAIEAGRLLRGRVDGLAVRLDVETGERTERVWLPNELCGCGGLSARPAPALRRESGSEPARPAPRSAAAPTRARALAAHA
jgi:hypothetical protein